ncbi:hypothetical protein CsSME_00026105 [Camellia sinensis var. sinensis]
METRGAGGHTAPFTGKALERQAFATQCTASLLFLLVQEKDRECGEASPRMSRIMALYSHGGTVPETQREITDLLSLSISTHKRLRALAMRHARRTACASACAADEALQD